MKTKKGSNILFSDFLSTSTKRNKVAVFHRLHPEVMYLSKKQWNELLVSIKGVDVRVIKKLEKRGLILNDLQIDKKEIKDLRLKMDYGLDTLYLVLTRNCNLKCSYCPFSCSSNELDSKELMSTIIAKKGIDFWIKAIGKHDTSKQYTIILYGGEPFLNTKTLEWVLLYIEKLKQSDRLPKKNLQVIADTNGVLLNEQIIKILKKHNVSVTVALDGLAKFNDQYRLNNDKKGTFSDVLKNIILLKKYKVITYVSMMAIPQKWNEKSIIDFCHFLTKYNITKLGTNLLRGERSIFIKQFFSDDSILKYQKWAVGFMINFWKQSRKLGVSECQIDRKMSSFISKKWLRLDCGGFGNHVVIQPNGEVGFCPWSYKYNLGKLEENFIDLKNKLNNPKNKYKELMPLYNSECLKCDAISICGGRCIWDHDEKKKKGMIKKNNQCIFTKLLFQYFIWNYPNILKIINDKKQS